MTSAVTSAVLLVARSAPLRAEVSRLAALAGSGLEVVTDPARVRGGWASAVMVVVEDELAPAVAALRLPARPGVVVTSERPGETAAWQAAVAVGAETVLTLPADDRRLLDRLLQPAHSTAPVVAVLPAGGGCGATVLAAALALAAADRYGAATLVDADPAAGGIDLLFGLERVAGLRLDELAEPDGVLAPAALRERAPAVHGVAVLSAGRQDPRPIPTETLRALLRAGRELGGPVVVDLPARLGAETDEAVATATCTVLVARGTVRAATAAGAIGRHLAARTARLALVVRRDPRDPLPPKEVAAAAALPLAGTVPTQAAIRRAVEHGDLGRIARRGRLAGTCRALLKRLDDG